MADSTKAEDTTEGQDGVPIAAVLTQYQAELMAAKHEAIMARAELQALRDRIAADEES